VAARPPSVGKADLIHRSLNLSQGSDIYADVPRSFFSIDHSYAASNLPEEDGTAKQG
jgi:hypothetical protein